MLLLTDLKKNKTVHGTYFEIILLVWIQMNKDFKNIDKTSAFFTAL